MESEGSGLNEGLDWSEDARGRTDSDVLDRSGDDRVGNSSNTTSDEQLGCDTQGRRSSIGQ